jgi:glutamate-1-semialdehyde 2,1-aminomutase
VAKSLRSESVAGSPGDTEAGNGALDDAASRRLFDRLQNSMPGANTRSATFYPPFPLAIERGEGAEIWDVDGNRLIDLVNNYTSLVHGHAAPAITAAIQREAARGTVFPAPTRLQAELAERLCERVDSVEMVRFTNSGTEAGMHAVRCARAATGRSLIVKVNNGYHGSWDGLPSSKDDCIGITGPVLEQLRWVDYNSVGDLEAVLTKEGERVAAIVLEPVLGCAVIPGEAEFLQAARMLADRHGALLVLDEVVTMRLDHAGYQRVLGVRPDLTTFGKLIGGGLPVGAFGGRSDLMELYDPRHPSGVEHHGTFNGNGVTMAAGVASLDLLTATEIERINGLGAVLARGLRGSLDAAGISASVTEAGSLVHVHFDVDPAPRCGADANPSSPLLARFHRAALERGVYIAPRGELNVTTAMDTDLVAESVERLALAIADTAAVS